jgi:hypothetical protein
MLRRAQLGKCILQIYAHSVESRMYAMGTPLIVPGSPVGSATTYNLVQSATVDVGTNITKLPREICLSNLGPSVRTRARAISRPLADRPRRLSRRTSPALSRAARA